MAEPLRVVSISVTERPIIFSPPMVRAILEGRKTQTRRVVKPSIVEAIEFMGGRCDGEPTSSEDIGLHWANPVDDDGKPVGEQWCVSCSEYPEEGMEPIGRGPYAVGDVLWVRESWCAESCFNDVKPREIPSSAPISYAATDSATGGKLRPSIFMPRWACRLFLRVISVRVERLQEISYDDAIAEGCGLDDRRENVELGETWEQTARRLRWPQRWFESLWNSLNAKRGYGWSVNPWVWVIEFDRIENH